MKARLTYGQPIYEGKGGPYTTRALQGFVKIQKLPAALQDE